MEILANTRIDFMRHSRIFVPLSALLVVVALLALVLDGLNFGIDFAGGTEIIVRFREKPEVDVLRGLLEEAGFEGPPQIQRFGTEDDNEVIIRTRLAEGQEEGTSTPEIQVLDRNFNGDSTALDLNQQGRAAISAFLLDRDPDAMRIDGEGAARAHYDQAAAAIMGVRRDVGLIDSWEQLEGLDGLSPTALEALRSSARLGAFSVLSSGSVSSQIGSELRSKGVWAVLLSLGGMLIYIWWRFELRFGVGAMVALAHDVILALGAFSIIGYEFDLTSIAAFLTVVGYSVNDTVVIFDRVRENLRRSRRQPLEEVINDSLNQTLSRTLLTSGTTILVVATLFLFGGDVLRGFSFVLLFGIIVGTYSSIWVASPVMLLFERLARRRR